MNKRIVGEHLVMHHDPQKLVPTQPQPHKPGEKWACAYRGHAYEQAHMRVSENLQLVTLRVTSWRGKAALLRRLFAAAR